MEAPEPDARLGRRSRRAVAPRRPMSARPLAVHTTEGRTRAGGSSSRVEEQPSQPTPTPVFRHNEEYHARDRALVTASLGGNLDAFNRLVELYQDMLYGICVRVVGDRDTAGDAVQEAFFSAYRNLAHFRGDSFRSWLTRIATNAATDILRSRKRKPADPFPEWEDDSWQPPTDESESPERISIQRQRSRVIAQAMTEITDDQRAAIVLFDVEGYDYQEIAEMTGVSLGTVKSRIHRGRLALRDLLAPEMELLRD